MHASILQLMNATPMPLIAHGAPVAPLRQLAELLLKLSHSHLQFSHAATFHPRMKKKRTTKSQLSWACSAENTKEVEDVMRDKTIDKVEVIMNGNQREMEEDTTEEKTMVKLTELSAQSFLFSS